MIEAGVAWAGNLKDFGPTFKTSWGKAEKPENVFFDLASLTKVIVTNSLLVEFCITDKVSLADFRQKALSYYWGSLDPRIGALTIGDIWDHQSGLKAHIVLNPNGARSCFAGSRADLWKFVLKKLNDEGFVNPIVSTDANETLYSDLDYWLLGALLEHVHKKDLAHLWTEFKIKYGLNKSDLIFGPMLTPLTFIRTEKRHQEGEVNDDNALFMQQLAPHAGLFGTAPGVWSWLELMKDWRSKSPLRETLRDYFEPAGNNRFWCGWDRPSGAVTQAGTGAPTERAIGHLGYTGTALWWDPESLWGGLLLTNRTYPAPSETNLAEIRNLRVNFFSLLWQNNKSELWKTLLEKNFSH